MGWLTYGHDDAKEYLNQSFLKKRLSHAYLIEGVHALGKFTLACDIACLFNCQKLNYAKNLESKDQVQPCGECSVCVRVRKNKYPDLSVIGERDDLSIGIGKITKLEQTAKSKPFEGKKRVFIVRDAEKLTIEAVNALLKTLEEPSKDVCIILTVSSASALPKTVLSRCQSIYLKPLSEVDIKQLFYEVNKNSTPKLSKEDESLVISLAQGKPGVVFDAFNDAGYLEYTKQALERAKAVTKADLSTRFKMALELNKGWQQNKNLFFRELDIWVYFWLSKVPDAQSNEELSDITKSLDLITQTLKALKGNANPLLALEVLTLGIPN